MADQLVTQPGLLEELALLRAEVARLQSAVGRRPRVTLETAQDNVFLGQPVALAITVVALATAEQDEPQPLAGARVTLATSWGILRTVDRFATQTGSSVTTQTGLDGVARATLLPAGTRHLEPAQQGALQLALESLDTPAAAPADLEPVLQALVAQYRWEGNIHLRRAIDVLFREYSGELMDRVAPLDDLQNWSFFNATITAVVETPPDAPDSATATPGMAIHTVRIIDWLGAWLQVYLASARTEDALPRDLSRARRQPGEPGALLDKVYGHVRDFVGSQYGIVGQAIGQRVAETALRDFASQGLADLPPETGVALSPTLGVAAETVARSGVNVLTAVTRPAWTCVRRSTPRFRPPAASRSTGWALASGAWRASWPASSTPQFTTASRLTLPPHWPRLTAESGELATQLAGVRDTSTSLVATLTALQSTFGQLDSRVGSVQASLNQLDGQLTAVQADLSKRIAAKAAAADLTALQNKTASALQAKADSAALTSCAPRWRINWRPRQQPPT